MPGRVFSSGLYAFGFNGKLNDRAWGGQLVQDYGFRIYNPAIGRFLSMDPLAPDYPWYTPYQFAGNKPIRYIDLDGQEEFDMFTVLATKKDGVLNMVASIEIHYKVGENAKLLINVGKSSVYVDYDLTSGQGQAIYTNDGVRGYKGEVNVKDFSIKAGEINFGGADVSTIVITNRSIFSHDNKKWGEHLMGQGMLRDGVRRHAETKIIGEQIGSWIRTADFFGAEIRANALESGVSPAQFDGLVEFLESTGATIFVSLEKEEFSTVKGKDGQTIGVNKTTYVPLSVDIPQHNIGNVEVKSAVKVKIPIAVERVKNMKGTEPPFKANPNKQSTPKKYEPKPFRRG